VLQLLPPEDQEALLANMAGRLDPDGVLLVRETPLHTGHLRTMTALSEMGAVIAPPVPAFYAKPQSLEEMIDQTLGRVLDLFGLDAGTVRRWGEPGH